MIITQATLSKYELACVQTMVLGKKLGYCGSISTGKILKPFGGQRFSSRENNSLFS
jgi:hypothetical protein